MNRDSNVTNDPTTLADRLRALLDFFEPVDVPEYDETTVLAKVADALTIDDIATLGGLIEGVRRNAEQRGARDLIGRLEDVVQEDAREIRAQAERYVEREEGTD